MGGDNSGCSMIRVYPWPDGVPKITSRLKRLSAELDRSLSPRSRLESTPLVRNKESAPWAVSFAHDYVTNRVCKLQKGGNVFQQTRWRCSQFLQLSSSCSIRWRRTKSLLCLGKDTVKFRETHEAVTVKMSLRYLDKVAIVTGGSKGIGKGTVRVFGRRGRDFLKCFYIL